MSGPLSLNTATLREHWGLIPCIEACARHGISAVAPWRDALAEAGGAQRAARHIRDAGLAVSSLCYAGFFTASDRGERRAAIDMNRRAIGEAHALGAACLALVSGGLPRGSRDLEGARAMVRDGLAAVLDEARAAGVTLALEPQHPVACADRSVVTTLAQASDLCDAVAGATPRRTAPLSEGAALVGHWPSLGIVLDVWHVWWDPDLHRQIARAQGRIAAFQASDWLAPTTELAPDRGMPGDGVIDIPRLRAMAEAAGYKGAVEIEVLSRRWWSLAPETVLGIIRQRYATSC